MMSGSGAVETKELEDRQLAEKKGGAPTSGSEPARHLPFYIAPGRQSGSSTFQEAQMVCAMKGQRICTRDQMADLHARGYRSKQCGWIIADNQQPAIARLADVWAESDCPRAEGADIYCCDVLNFDTFKTLDEPYNRAALWLLQLEAAVQGRYNTPIPLNAEFIVFGGGSYGVAVRKTGLASYTPISHSSGTAPKQWPSLTDVPRCQVNDTSIPSGSLALFINSGNLPITAGKPWGQTDSQPIIRVMRGDSVTLQPTGPGTGTLKFRVAPASHDSPAAIESGQIITLRTPTGFLAAGKGVGTMTKPQLDDQGYWKVTVQGENSWTAGSKVILTNISSGQYLNGLDGLSGKMEVYRTVNVSSRRGKKDDPCQRLQTDIQYSRALNGKPDSQLVSKYQSLCYNINGATFQEGISKLRQSVKSAQEAILVNEPDYNSAKMAADAAERELAVNKVTIEERRAYLKERTPKCAPVKTCVPEIGCPDPLSAPSDSSLGLASIDIHPDFAKYIKYTDIPPCKQ
jgi:hypothetical protein